MDRCLIYKRGRMYRTLDTAREIVIGWYYTPMQARQGWAVYEAQGRVGCGFDYTQDDEFITDFYRKEHENKIKASLHASRQSFIRYDSERIRQIENFIERCRN